MSEQLSLYFDTLEELSEKDQEYMSRKYRHVLERLDEIDALLNEVSKLGMKNLSRGVKVTVLEGVVTVDLNLNIEYGKNILETSKKVQEKVKSSIENMTGLEVADVNIHIASVDMENEKGK